MGLLQEKLAKYDLPQKFMAQRYLCKETLKEVIAGKKLS